MKEYYIFKTEEQAINCINFISGSEWFPIIGDKLGTPNPSAQKTVRWVSKPREMASGEWAVSRIPQSRLDELGVPQENRDAFMAAFGQDIRALDIEDFPPPPETP
jgi:hypothetical protein